MTMNTTTMIMIVRVVSETGKGRNQLHTFITNVIELVSVRIKNIVYSNQRAQRGIMPSSRKDKVYWTPGRL